MPPDGARPARSARGLDLLNFFIADVQTGFGPFVAVYLTAANWTQVEIGFALSLGTVTAIVASSPPAPWSMRCATSADSRRWPAWHHRRGPAAGGLAGRTAGAAGAGAARRCELPADPGDRRDQPATGRPCRAGRAARPQRALRVDRQRDHGRGDGRYRQLSLQPRGVLADRRAVRARTVRRWRQSAAATAPATRPPVRPSTGRAA